MTFHVFVLFSSWYGRNSFKILELKIFLSIVFWITEIVRKTWAIMTDQSYGCTLGLNLPLIFCSLLKVFWTLDVHLSFIYH